MTSFTPPAALHCKVNSSRAVYTTWLLVRTKSRMRTWLYGTYLVLRTILELRIGQSCPVRFTSYTTSPATSSTEILQSIFPARRIRRVCWSQKTATAARRNSKTEQDAMYNEKA